MIHWPLRAFAIVLVISVTGGPRAEDSPAPPASQPARTQPRPAEAILKDFRATEIPPFDTSNTDDTGYIRKYVQQRDKLLEQRHALAAELYQSHPDHPEVPALLLDTWQERAPRNGEEVLKESAEYLRAHPDSPKKAEVLFVRAAATFYSTRDRDKTLAAAEEFIAAAPGDDRGAMLLATVADQTRDPGEAAKLRRRIAEQFPTSASARLAQGHDRQADAVGKPFSLAFTDAISGRQVSVEKLRGKVVVIDFWATWCGPCVAEMPKMKELYARFKPRGVEFIGVSLDQPESEDGLKHLTQFVAKNEIPWPQYYQGKGWDSDFSSSWGIDSIPRVFLIDADGKLSSTEARGQLEKLIPDLLAKRDGKPAKPE